jgi:hypothetical protein
MRLVDDWQKVLARAWSVRFLFLGTAMTGLAGCWFALADYTPIWLFIAGGMVVPMMALAARLISQKDFRDDNG